MIRPCDITASASRAVQRRGVPGPRTLPSAHRPRGEAAVRPRRRVLQRRRRPGVRRRPVRLGRCVRRGEIWTAAGGVYAAKPRPVLMIQDDHFSGTDSVTVCPMTTAAVDAPLLLVPV